MADRASSSLSASIFLDEIKSSISGNLSYEPAVAIAAGSGEGWVFKEKSIGSSGNLLGTGDNYLGGTVGAVAVGDIYKWLAIKNISSTATDGIGLCLDGGTSAYNLQDGIFIGAGELLIMKCSNATVELLHAASITMDGTYGYPSAAHAGTVNVMVAAILKNIG